jgi:thiol:disulfide interchange protein
MIRSIRITLAAAAALTFVTIGALQAQDKMKPMDKMSAPMSDKNAADKNAMNAFKPFTKEAFAAATAEGKTTLVFFHAPWCPVCKAQEPKVLAHLNNDAKDVVAFKVDYDTNKALRQEMNVAKQSTLILYRGKQELGRLSYKSDDASIDELFTHASMGMMD